MGAIQSFSSILPTLTGTLGTVQSIVGTVGAIQQLANPNAEQESQQDLAMQQLQARQALEEQQLAAQTELERQQLAIQASAADTERQNALRRAVARQRAQFGASGISGGAGGSADAVLLGLFEESEEDRNKREGLDNIRNQALDLDEAQNRSLNLLQATQLSEKQNLANLF